MTGIEMRAAQTSRDRKRFLCFPWRVYAGDPLWVPPLLPQRAEAIDPARGAFFRHGEAQLFLCCRDGELAGTICVGHDRSMNEARGTQECLIGFLEYLPDRRVFEAMMRHAASWARARGLNTLWGPFNLDYEDGYGVLIEGRDRPPALLCGHTPPYYAEFMEGYGFEPARADNLAYGIQIEETEASKRLRRLAQRVRAKGRIQIRGARFDDWAGEIGRIHRLLQLSLGHLPSSPIPWEREAVESLVAPFRRLADPELVLFAEVNGRAVGWMPAVPNLNEALIHANGLCHPWDYAKLWWHMHRPIRTLAVKSVLVEPEYWNRGVAVLLFDELLGRARARGYSWADLSLTSEDNPQTPLLATRMGAVLYKRYRVYQLSL